VLKKFKFFSKEKLKQELGLTKVEEKAPTKSEDKKDLGQAANPQH
jgi:hypothetical protein